MILMQRVGVLVRISLIYGQENNLIVVDMDQRIKLCMLQNLYIEMQFCKIVYIFIVEIYMKCDTEERGNLSFEIDFGYVFYYLQFNDFNGIVIFVL